jgi:dihydroorotate dehydrogenase electron transfer subunit
MNIKKFDSRFVALPIKQIIPENDYVNTYVFDYPLGGKPGQFLMLWLPGVEEKPMSTAISPITLLAMRFDNSRAAVWERRGEGVVSICELSNSGGHK